MTVAMDLRGSGRGTVGRRRATSRHSESPARPIKAAAGLAIALMIVTASAAGPTSAYSALLQGKGFDTCAAPSATTMDKWWVGTPWLSIGVYLGGINRSCSQPNLTASWVTHVRSFGWGLLPLWVGPQMGNDSCQTVTLWNANISTNTTTADNQGVAEAKAAISAAANLGMDLSDMPLIYDLEGYYGTGAGKPPPRLTLSQCRSIAKAFINGWDHWLSLPTAQRSGVYGSACSSYLNDFASITDVPDFLFFGDHSGVPSTMAVSHTCIPATRWVNSQRHKQYVGTHNETWGGVTLSIDTNCSDGPVYNQAQRLDPNSPCL